MKNPLIYDMIRDDCGDFLVSSGFGRFGDLIDMAGGVLKIKTLASYVEIPARSVSPVAVVIGVLLQMVKPENIVLQVNKLISDQLGICRMR